MAITIDLKPELEAQLRKAAAKSGMDTSAFVAHALEERLRREARQRAPSSLSPEESSLLLKINQGLPEAVWHEYQDLIARRRVDTLTPEEQTRLIALSDQIETFHTERMATVAELARTRQIPLKTLLKQLGVEPRKI